MALDPSLSLLFACETVADAEQAFAAEPPDLLLCDMQLPDGSGLTLIRQASAAGKLSLMLTVLGDRASVLGALQEGAQGYLLKDMSPDQISAGIQGALAGQIPLSPQVAAHVLQLVRRIEPPTRVGERLTERELSILNMIARGLSYAETARAADISIHTVGDHIKAIYRKLDVRSKNEAIHEARQLGWLSRFD